MENSNFVVLIHSTKNQPSDYAFIQELVNWLQLRDLTVYDIETESQFSHQMIHPGCGVVILTRDILSSDECRDWWREILISQKELYILSKRSLVDEFASEYIPYHLRGRLYLNLDHPEWLEVFADCLNLRRQLPKNHPAIGSLPSEKGSTSLVTPDISHIANIQTLRRAWLKVWNYARFDATYYDELSYSMYHENIDGNLLALSEALQRQSFRLQPLLRISVPKQSREEAEKTNKLPEMRDLYFALPETSIVLQTICDLIGPKIEPLLDFSIYEAPTQQNPWPQAVFANRLLLSDSGTVEIFRDWRESHADFRHSIKNFAYETPGAVYFKTDIRKYYPSIYKGKLIEEIKQIVDDPYVLTLLEQFLDLKAVDDAGNHTAIPGIPAGIPLAHLLGNFYLNSVDVQMSRHALRYFRYVDDVLFFARDHKDLMNLKSLFINLLANVAGASAEGNGLSIHLESENPNKSKTGIAKDIDELDAAIEQLSPLLRMDFTEFPDGTQKQKIAQFIYDTLIAVENFEDENADEVYAKYAALAVYKLKDLEFREDLSEIVYTFLVNAPLRSRTIRWLIDYLIMRVVQYPDDLDRLRVFLSDPFTTDFVRLAFLQAVRSYGELPPKIWDLVSYLAKNENALVAGEAAYTLSESKQIFPDKEVSRYIYVRITQEISVYFKIRAFWFVIKSQFSQQQILELVKIFLSSGNLHQQTVAYYSLSLKKYIKKSLVKRLYTETEYEQSNIPLFALVPFLKWLGRLIAGSSNQQYRENIITTISNRMQRFSPQIRADLLASLLGKTLNLSELKDIQNSILSVQQARLVLEEQNNNSDDEIYFWGKYKKIEVNSRLENPHRHDYLSIRVEWNRRVGFLEIIRNALIESRGFKNLESWNDYLKSIEQNRVSLIVDVIDLKNGNIAIIYEIPNGYQALSDWFVDNNNHWLTGDAVRFLANVNRKSSFTSTKVSAQIFRFVTIHSEFLLIASSLDVYFVCIGASLDNTPLYLVSKSHSNQYKDIEDANIGFEAYSLFLGYLLIELLLRKNPLELKEIGEKARQYLSDIQEFAEFKVHIRAFIARSANKLPKLRYTDYDAVHDDLTHIAEFHMYLALYSDTLTDDQKLLAEFVDYLCLRIKTHRRNPEISMVEPENRMSTLVKSVSKDFVRFTAHNTVKRDWLIQRYLHSEPTAFLDQALWDWLSVPSRRLLRTFAMWKEMIQEYATFPSPHVSLVLQLPLFALSFQAVMLEHAAYLQTMARWAGNHLNQSDIRPDFLWKARYFARELPPEAILHTAFGFSGNDCEVVLHSLDELYLPSNVNSFNLPYGMRVTSRSVLFSSIIGGVLVTYDETDAIIWKPNLGPFSSQEEQRRNWQLSTLMQLLHFKSHLEYVFPALPHDYSHKSDPLEKQIAFYIDVSEIGSSFDPNATERLLVSILEGLRQSNIGKRLSAKIQSYIPKLGDASEGLIKYYNNLPAKSFTHKDLIEPSRRILIPPDGAPATVDVYQGVNQGQELIGAILVNPPNVFEIFVGCEHADVNVVESFKGKVMRDQIFISYAHADKKEHLDELLKRLKPLERNNLIPKAWSDNDIKVSTKWKKAIEEALQRAKIAILLITPDFFGSDFIANNELKPIYEAHERGELKIIAIACSSTNYGDYDEYLASIQWANAPDAPLDLAPSKGEFNKAWVQIISTIKEATL